MACQKGKLKAQRELYDRYAYMMKGVCLRYARDVSEAEDYLQEAFLRAFKSIHQLNPSGNLGAWLRTIAVNVGLEMYRKNKAIDLRLENYKHIQGNSVDLETAFEKMALEDLVKKIQRLPLGYRTVFNLYAIEGFNHEEIAQKLEISAGTSKSQYSRARSLLRQWIEEEEENEKNQMNYAKG
ncbi:sigma-70 family RNA polymerase sigma factor [Lishizhenia sp.]|uniref:RNA polymerase sigma factor n=1 Tax=Lishizhenia sp. TaxID=2497594 RepID=UPI00299D2FF2|nr:sigma-70 family RNA polymerase sigma factor [Lishizhenia sp.]MDX1445294.1 sigma-70 family RNA polymerase sigma factor [Lishizhenia sp.]